MNTFIHARESGGRVHSGTRFYTELNGLNTQCYVRTEEYFKPNAQKIVYDGPRVFVMFPLNYQSKSSIDASHPQFDTVYKTRYVRLSDLYQRNDEWMKLHYIALKYKTLNDDVLRIINDHLPSR